MGLGEIEWGGIVWTVLAEDRDNCRTLVEVTLKFGFHKMLGNY
jgi:hypothetical protein